MNKYLKYLLNMGIGISSGIVFTLFGAVFEKIFGLLAINDFVIVFLTYSLFLYPAGAWLGITIYNMHKTYHFWMSLAGLFLSMTIFLLLSQAFENWNFYVYWSIFYLMIPIFTFLGALKPFLKKF